MQITVGPTRCSEAQGALLILSRQCTIPCTGEQQRVYLYPCYCMKFHSDSPRPCRRLLAQVCLVREEVQNVARTAAFGRGDSWTPTSDKTAQLRGGVPRRAVAFLQVLQESGLRCLTSPTVPGACGTSVAL
jgi:hypothetical protein